jgi:predicted membrane channel-forming protein YqfA (hemolysin III family)
MKTFDVQNLFDSALACMLSIFTLGYFSIFLCQFIIFRFPTGQESIPMALSMIAFGSGVMLWSLCVFCHRAFNLFDVRTAQEQKNITWCGLLFLVWTAALPTIVILLPAQPLLQLGYMIIFTIMALGNLPEYAATEEMATEIPPNRLPFHMVCVVLFALVPTMHALAEPVTESSSLATAFGRFVLSNTLGAAVYLLEPFERIIATPNSNPSLYIMHLILVFSLISYSRVVFDEVASRMS